MKAPKTVPTDASVQDFIAGIDDKQRQEDAFKVDTMMREASGKEPVMWGDAIIGYGTSPVIYANGEELDWPAIGFSPRKQNLTLYVLNDDADKYADLFEKLGKHSTSKVCLYIKRLSDVDLEVLQEVITRAWQYHSTHKSYAAMKKSNEAGN